MSGFPIIFGGGFDPNALAYFTTAGIGTEAVTPTAYDSAASFNGSTQYLTTPSFSQTGSFTISLWVYPTSSTYNGILVKGTFSAYDWQIFTIGTNVYLQGGTGQAVSINTPITLNAWNHLVVTYDSSTLIKTIRVNNGTAVSNTGTGTMPNSYSVIILAYMYALVALTGNAAGMGYWSRVLSSTEITSLYNGGIGLTYSGIQGAGLTTNLVSYWALNQNSVTADSAGSNTLTNTGSVTASATSPIASATASSRQLINSFVKGVKGLGLWSNMVCWPLRSSQNANGTTAYSLGGAGTYNGTLTNIPVGNWTSTGLLNSSTGYVTTTLLTGSTASNNFIVVNEIVNGSKTYYGDLTSSNSKGARARDDQFLVGNGTSYTSIPYSATSLNNFKSLNYDVTASTATVYLNGSSIATGSLTVLPPASTIPISFLAANDAGSVAQYMLGTMSFYMWQNTNLSFSSTASLYSLYKQTIGQGLGLP